MSNALVNPRPPAEIGLFDSGVGGLTVLRELRALLPDADLRYVADTAYAPYGERSPDDIRQRSLLIAEHLIASGARLIVVACNTATAHAIDALRARWPGFAFVGTEPGIKPAVAATRNGKIGVLTTPATAKSARLRALIERHATGVQVLVQGCPGIVEHIEAADLHSDQLRLLVDSHCTGLVAGGVDTVLLGCTHYPMIEPLWRSALGPEVLVLRIETAVARRAAELWREPAGRGRCQIECSADASALRAWIERVLGWQAPAVEQWLPEGAEARGTIAEHEGGVVPGTGLEPVLPFPEGGF
jgi:glutamate racemase